MKHLSSSRMELHDICPLSFYFKYIEELDEFDPVVEWHADLGSLMHTVMEKLAKREYGVDQAKIHFTNNYPYCYIPEEHHEELYHLALTGIERKAAEISKMDILAVEMEFSYNIQFGIPNIYGFADLVYRDEKGLVIRDYKKSKPFDKTTLKKKLQPYVYALAVKEKFGEMPYKFEFDFPLYDQTASFVIDEVFMQLARLKIVAAWNRIKNSSYVAQYNPFWCESFCGYRQICPVYLMKVGN